MTDYLATVCWRIGRMAAGRAASSLEPDARELVSPAGVAVLPSWLWLPPKADMGRKGTGLVPVRVAYRDIRSPGDRAQPDAGPVFVVPAGRAVQLHWEGEGAGWDISGSIELSADAGAGSSRGRRSKPERSPSVLPTALSVQPMEPGAVGSGLRHLTEDGSAARWELTVELSKMASKYIWRARSKVLHLIESGKLVVWREGLGDWMSHLDVDAMADQIVLGTDERPSRAASLLERCLAPGTFRRVDPLRYISTSLSCAASQAVGRYLGDPAIGPEVRRTAERLGISRDWPPPPEDLELLLKEHRAAHPGHRLGEGRALRALKLRSWSASAPARAQVADTAEDAVSSISASALVEAVVRRCLDEGGATLAAVAERWLSAAAAGRELDVVALASELGAGVGFMAPQLERARLVAVEVASELSAGTVDPAAEARFPVRTWDIRAALAKRDDGSEPLSEIFGKSARSPLRYPGSKRRLAPVIGKLIAATFPEPPLLFVEPFCGGASVSLRLLVEDRVKKVQLNDADPLIWAFWYTAAYDTAWLIDAMYSEKVTVERWEHYRNSDPRKRRDLAMKCLFLNRTSFSGILHRSAGPIGGMRQESAYKIDCRFNKPELARRLAFIGELAERGRILNVSQLDYRDLLTQLRAELPALAVPDDAVCVYLDPPYVEKAERLYERSFGDGRHDALRGSLDDLPWHWALSYDDHDAVRSRYGPGLFGERRVIAIRVPGNYSTAGPGARQRRDELLLTTLSPVHLASVPVRSIPLARSA